MKSWDPKSVSGSRATLRPKTRTTGALNVRTTCVTSLPGWTSSIIGPPGGGAAGASGGSTGCASKGGTKTEGPGIRETGGRNTGEDPSTREQQPGNDGRGQSTGDEEITRTRRSTKLGESRGKVTRQGKEMGTDHVMGNIRANPGKTEQERMGPTRLRRTRTNGPKPYDNAAPPRDPKIGTTTK